MENRFSALNSKLDELIQFKVTKTDVAIGAAGAGGAGLYVRGLHAPGGLRRNVFQNIGAGGVATAADVATGYKRTAARASMLSHPIVRQAAAHDIRAVLSRQAMKAAAFIHPK
jgi:hypothetical protein